MSDNDVRPSAMSKYMDRRNERFAAVSNQTRRVKIEQNHTWRIRLLPVQLGPDKEPFIDIAQHWWNKSPMTCPKHTGEAWGGNPDFPCPVCETSERLSSSSSEEISNLGYKVRVNLRVRSYCVVFEMEDQRGNVDEMPLSEILIPYEFDMFKTTWERFSKFQKWAMSGRRGGVESSEWGILDLETGCDMLATAGAKGITLDRCDPNPIFSPDEPKFDEYIKKIWSHIRKPNIIIPSEKQLLEMAVKIEEFAETGGVGRRRGRDDEDSRGRGRGGRGRFSEDDEGSAGGFRGRAGRGRFAEDSEDDGASRPSSRRGFNRSAGGDDDSGSPAPLRRRTPDPEPEPAEAGAANPPPPTRRSAAQTQRPAAQEQRAEPEQEQSTEPDEQAATPPPRRSTAAIEPSPRRSAPTAQAQVPAEKAVTDEDMAEDQNPNPAPPPPARRGSRPTAPPPARQATAETDAEPAEPGEPVAPPPARRTAAAPAQNGVDEEEDNVPEERRDVAPPVRQRVADEAPPEVAIAAPPARRVGDNANIKARLDKLTSKAR